jgi:hypothetical protein
MKKWLNIYSVLLVMLAISSQASGSMPERTFQCPTGPVSRTIAEPEMILQSYFAAVDRGELRSFERKLGRADINPVHVQYNYMIATGSLEIKIYSQLKEPVPMPGQPDYQVIGVCSAMEHGRIVETESHVFLK